MRHKKLIGAESGFLLIAGATLILTALIGGAALLSVIATRRPIGGALERLDKNTATPQDMEALQGAGQDFVRSAQILRAGGSLIGGRGPIPNVGGGAGGAAQRILQVKPATGGLPPLPSAADRAMETLGRAPIGGEQTIAGVVNRAIGSLATRASQPPLTRDNLSGGAPLDFGAIDRLGQQSQEEQYGGRPPGPTSGAAGGGLPIEQPGLKPPLGAEFPTTGTGGPVSPGPGQGVWCYSEKTHEQYWFPYGPCPSPYVRPPTAGGPPHDPRVPWQELVPPSIGGGPKPSTHPKPACGPTTVCTCAGGGVGHIPCDTSKGSCHCGGG